NVVLPDRITDNLESFRRVFRSHHLSGEVVFAHKASRSSALVRQLAATDAAIDVASLGELQHVLGAGFGSDRIVATGPKNPGFLWLAALTGAVVHVDGRGELEELVGLVRKHSLERVRILLRLSGFEAPGPKMRSRGSRFGTGPGSLGKLLDAVESHQDVVEPIGTAFHLDTTSLQEKAVAFEGCLQAIDALRDRGLRPYVLDIGGGFGVDYLAHGAEWDRYTTELTAAVLGKRGPLTWAGHGYGLRVENGTLRGALGLYPAHRPVAGAAYLDALLSSPAPTLGRPLGTLLLESLCDLYVEPGRALTDQCGLTLARVLEVRCTDDGEYLVQVAAKATDIGLEAHGVLVDPVLLPREGRPERGEVPVGVYLTGSLCLETDLITRRTVFLPRLPQPGDLLGFVNTAGYCMDFVATNAQQQPTAHKVAVYQDAGDWHWCLDEQYWPISRHERQQT
ncbi:MAG: Y4yA family PLP-dependent enzyme, partial [Mycobacterium sp.]|nr:Y4yA family PLP-dependent enzyme [Mycobacterium sp.]